MRWRAGLAAILAAIFLAEASGAGSVVLRVEPVPLRAGGDSVDRAGQLRFLGGLRLRSPGRRFGGLSGLDISPDGRHIRFVSDAGFWIRAEPEYGSAGRLVGMANAEIGRLLGPGGKPVARKREADAESLTPVDGGFAVAFERDHRIWVYRAGTSPFLSRPRRVALPQALERGKPNKGIEALATLQDGRFVILAEDFPSGAAVSQGWIRDGRGWDPFRYRRTGLFQPTGAATLPDGDLLVLERRFTYVGGVASRLARVARSALKSGALVRGRQIARLEPPLIVENFEGVDARRDSRGRTLIYLVSDDNYSGLQRTLLLLFALDRP